MSDNYTVDIPVRRENLSDEEFDALVSELKDVDEGVDIAGNEGDGSPSANSAENAAFLTVVSLTVSGTDLLLTLYQMARTHPYTQGFSIRDSPLKILSDNEVQNVQIHGDVYVIGRDNAEGKKHYLVDTSKVTAPPSEETEE